jgi:hypothetical protein
MKKEPEGLKSTNQSPPAMETTKNDDDFNFSNQSKYKKFSNFLKESSKEAKQQQNKIIECKCCVCKILNSSSLVIDKTTAVTKRYEAYNIVSETSDSIFYDPSLLSNTNNDDFKGEIYVSVDRIRDIVQDELAKQHLNGVNFNKNEY